MYFIKVIFYILFLIFMTETISRIDEGQPRPKYILINVELTSTFLLYRGLVHHHHRILKVYLTYIRFGIILTQVYVNFSRKLDRSLIGIVQLLRFSDFSLNPLSFFLYGPFNLTDNYNI